MSLGVHAGFILAAYGAASAVVGALVLWVLVDYRAQRRAIAALEAQGITRRSARLVPEDTH
jgi:heme exporter protein D